MIDIVPFIPVYEDGVVDLILPIQQREFGLPIDLHDQSDLQEISAFYQNGAGNFWVALDDGVVVGSVGLLDIGHEQAALRKMFVAAPKRGKPHRVAENLLAELLAWSRRKRLREIYLGTTEKFTAAQRFYRKHAFAEISKSDLPARFPVMAVDSVFFTRAVDAGEFAESDANLASDRFTKIA